MKDDKIYYSWSAIKTYMECPQQYKLHYIDRLRPKIKAQALCAGHAMSRALEAYRMTNSRDKGTEALVLAAKEPDSSLAETKNDDEKRSIERLIEIFWGYVAKYPDDPDRVMRAPGHLDSAEIYFSFDVFDDFVFRGIIDCLFLDKDQVITVIEDKTSSRFGDSFFAYHKSSPQVLWYMYAAHRLGLFEMSKSSPKCIINGIYIHPKNLRYERDITIKNTKTLNNAYHDLVEWIKIIETCKHEDRFPRNTMHCTQYGGCDYLCLKDVEGKLRERIIAENFRVSKNGEKS